MPEIGDFKKKKNYVKRIWHACELCGKERWVDYLKGKPIASKCSGYKEGMMKDFLELLGDLFIVLLGVLMIYIFLVIEVFGMYGQEMNEIIRRAEFFMGFPIILFGIYHFVKDIPRKK